MQKLLQISGGGGVLIRVLVYNDQYQELENDQEVFDASHTHL
jgi:hypothetical protein